MKIPCVVLALALAAPILAAPPALPDSTAADRTGVAVTVYNVNLALVRETRSLDVPRAGVGALRFVDVPSAINPRTVHLKDFGPGGSTLSVLEQNYEFDLISPE